MTKVKRSLLLLIFFLGGVISPLIVSLLSTLFIGIIDFLIAIVVILSSNSVSLIDTLIPLIAIVAFILSWIFHYRIFYRTITSFHKSASAKLQDLTSLDYKNENFLTGIWWLFCFLFTPLFFLASLAIPPFPKPKASAITSAAMNTIATIAKECAVKKANRDIKPTFDVPILDNYTFKPENGNCDGNKNNSFTAVSEDLSKYPTFSYNVLTGAKTCSHDGPKEELHGCSARRNGEW